MNLIGIGSHVINLDQVTRIHLEEESVTCFFANQMPVSAYGGSEQSDKVDQLKFLGQDAESIKKFLHNDKNVIFLDRVFSHATSPKPKVEKWETDNDFPSKHEWFYLAHPRLWLNPHKNRFNFLRVCGLSFSFQKPELKPRWQKWLHFILESARQYSNK